MLSYLSLRDGCSNDDVTLERVAFARCVPKKQIGKMRPSIDMLEADELRMRIRGRAMDMTTGLVLLIDGLEL